MAATGGRASTTSSARCRNTSAANPAADSYRRSRSSSSAPMTIQPRSPRTSPVSRRGSVPRLAAMAGSPSAIFSLTLGVGHSSCRTSRSISRIAACLSRWRVNALGWVERVTSNEPLVNDYLSSLRSRKPGQAAQDRVLVVAPTHAQGDEITAAMQSRLKADAAPAADERELPRLVALNWTEAERADPVRRHRDALLPPQRRHVQSRGPGPHGRLDADRYASAAHSSVYRADTLPLAEGDRVRFTAPPPTPPRAALWTGCWWRCERVRRGGGCRPVLRPRQPRAGVGPRLHRLFVGEDDTYRVTVSGRNLARLYALVVRHRMEWLEAATRDFAGDGQCVITEITVEKVEAKR